MIENKKINCVLCKHFVVTWDKEQPRACKQFGFKGKCMPNITVLKVTGKPCPVYEPQKRK